MTAQSFLKVENLSKHFPIRTGVFRRTEHIVRAVEDVSFELEQGQTLALVGESGCGKTTLARMLLKLISPTSGRFFLNGSDMTDMWGAALRDFRSDVQAVFQDPWASLSPRMRVFDIIAEGLRLNHDLGDVELTDRVNESLRSVGLRSEDGRKYPHEFSGGQRQRIAIASAIIEKPKLIILDEPVSALDVSIRSQIMNLFKDIQAEFRCSYIIVAHDLGTTRFMADKVAVMYLGSIVELGSTDKMFDAPDHPYTKALLSAALPVKQSGSDPPIVLKGEVPSPVDPPTGCPFHPRCQSYIGEHCSTIKPAWRESGPNNHWVRCHIVQD